MNKKHLLILILGMLMFAGLAVGIIWMLAGGNRTPVVQAQPETVQPDRAEDQSKKAAEAKLASLKAAQAGDAVDLEGLSQQQLRSLFFSSALTSEQIEQITGVTFLPDQDFITTDQLKYIKVLHTGFDGQTKVGELIVNENIADDIENIFYELYLEQYPIEQIRLASVYKGDDYTNMVNNNTNAFSFRLSDGYGIVEHEHSLGLAVDFNPLYNPYIKIGDDETESVWPPESQPFQNRSNLQDHMISHDDAAWKIFTKYGFDWGGDWENGVKDYQHFEKYDHIPISQTYYIGNVLKAREQQEQANASQ